MDYLSDRYEVLNCRDELDRFLPSVRKQLLRSKSELPEFKPMTRLTYFVVVVGGGVKGWLSMS